MGHHTYIKTVKVKKLREEAKLPYHGSEMAAGYDLSACIDKDIIIRPGETVKIGTGLAMACPPGYYGNIVSRSGMGIKRGLRIAQGTGTVDLDYTGEWIVALHNDSDEEQAIHPGDRIAQVVFLPYLPVHFDEVEELEVTERGDGGFGASGMQ